MIKEPIFGKVRVTCTSLSVPILNLDSTSLLSIVLDTLREATCLQSRVDLDEYCSTVQGLLDWFEVDLGFTELLFIQIDLCVMCVFVLDRLRETTCLQSRVETRQSCRSS